MNQLVPAAPTGDIIESVIIKGDLGKLSPEDRSRYYMQVCASVGLNPMTKPFEYITLNGRLTLYALRGCTDQLRAIHNVSVEELTEEMRGDVIVVTAKMRNGKGRSDMAKGAVTIGNLKGDALANAIMKAETKAKRRATLSLCGLGFLDETEIETIPQTALGKRTQAEISANAARKRQELRDVEKDISQLETLAACERYEREVLTPEFMAGLGAKSYVADEYMGKRRRELENAAAPIEPEDDPTDEQLTTFNECWSYLEASSNEKDLYSRATNAGYVNGCKGLTEPQKTKLRELYNDLKKGFANGATS